MPHTRIASANPAQWPTIAALLTACELPLDGAREHLENFLVAIDGEQLIGVIGMETHGKVGLLRSFATVLAARNAGLGARLLTQLEDAARKAGITRLYLLTTTAEHYFAGKNYIRLAREQAPPELADSAEFRGACPATAVLMAQRQVVAEERG